MRDLWFGTSGAEGAPIVLVGESWGREEATAQRPFVGTSGTELRRMLVEAGISDRDVLFANLVAERPTNNETWRFFVPKEFKPERIGGLAPGTLARSEITRLFEQIKSHPRKLIISAGAYATWALSKTMGSKVISTSNNRKVAENLQTWGPTGILSWRGSMLHVETHEQLGSLPAIPLLPLIHPAAIQREWYLRSPTVHDLRTRVPMALKGDWRPCPMPTILATPTFSEVCDVLDRWLSTEEWIDIAADCETIQPILTCFGFADSTSFALVVPFVRIDGGFITSCWTIEQESQIVARIRALFRHPKIRITGQNFIYDTQYAQYWFGVTPRLDWDTMLAQNVMFPGTPKDLGYLASLYCDYYWYWKEDGKTWNPREHPLEQHLLYNGWDCLRTWEVMQSQRILMNTLDLGAQMKLKMEINGLCLRMMNRGVRIDAKRRAGLKLELNAANNAVADEIEQIVPQHRVVPGAKTRWYKSAKQKSYFFYDQLAFRPVKDPKSGNLTTGKRAFAQWRVWYPEFTGLFNRMRLLDTLENTANVVSMGLDSDSRVRCSFNPGGAETHRLSSSKNAFGGGTNLQNLTKGEEDE